MCQNSDPLNPGGPWTGRGATSTPTSALPATSASAHKQLPPYLPVIHKAIIFCLGNDMKIVGMYLFRPNTSPFSIHSQLTCSGSSWHSPPEHSVSTAWHRALWFPRISVSSRGLCPRYFPRRPHLVGPTTS